MWSGELAATNWVNSATTWSRPGGLVGGAVSCDAAPWILSFVAKIGGSVTVTVFEAEVAVSPLVVFDAVTVNGLTGDPFPL